jgi:hypothetical protein
LQIVKVAFFSVGDLDDGTDYLLEWAIGEMQPSKTSGIGALPFVANPGNLRFER